MRARNAGDAFPPGRLIHEENDAVASIKLANLIEANRLDSIAILSKRMFELWRIRFDNITIESRRFLVQLRSDSIDATVFSSPCINFDFCSTD